MFRVGVTGGIGSGKSTVCQVFNSLGIPVLRADDVGKFLLEHHEGVVASMKALFGDAVYNNGMLNNAVVSDLIFKDAKLLEKMNAIVHPPAIQYAKEWLQRQSTPYVIKEAAIFFESGTHTEMDFMVGVSAPEEVRISRVMVRGNSTREKVKRIIANQMEDTKKMALCDAVIINDDIQAVIPQVMALHQRILRHFNV